MSNGEYLYNIFSSVKDDPTVLKNISETIVKYANMTEQGLAEQIKNIDKGIQQTEKEKQFVVDVYKSQDCSKLVKIFDDGTIRTAGENPFIIEDESLKEKIYAQLYFQEMQGTKEKFEERVNNFYDNGRTDFVFSKETNSPLARKKVFSAMKITAREQGYVVLNSLSECESGENIQIQAVKTQKGKQIGFEDLKSIYQRFGIFYKDDDYTQLYVKDRQTGMEITDLQIVTMGKFAAIWGGAAGTKWMADEEISGITYAFNDSSERVYTKLGELIGKSMTEKGTIDTEAVYKAISGDQYKHSEEIVRTLLSNPASVKIVYDFYKMQNDDARMETRLAKTTNDFIFGYGEDKIVRNEVEEAIKSIPDLKPQKIKEIIEAEMVTLPNGVRIPTKQYEEEYLYEQGKLQKPEVSTEPLQEKTTGTPQKDREALWNEQVKKWQEIYAEYRAEKDGDTSDDKDGRKLEKLPYGGAVQENDKKAKSIEPSQVENETQQQRHQNSVASPQEESTESPQKDKKALRDEQMKKWQEEGAKYREGKLKGRAREIGVANSERAVEDYRIAEQTGYIKSNYFKTKKQEHDMGQSM